MIPRLEWLKAMGRLLKYFQDKPIGQKMFSIYSFIVLVAVLLVGMSVYVIASRTIKQNIESELSSATAAILNMVETTAQASIKNYLRAVAEKNLEIVSLYYADVQNGLISEEAAKAQIRKVLLNQTIGDTGYIYCLDSAGVAAMHPDPLVEGVDFSDFEFIQKQIQRREGYLEYEWKNPGEAKPRPKALYMTYFEPWDWIISVSSYRSEFSRLINISDFKANILSQTFGRTGYSYILESDGDVVVHPHLSGNLWDARDANGYPLVRHQCRTKNGKLFYSWRNPGEDRFREKLVIYNYIPEYDWVVASTGYLEEFYSPLSLVRQVVAAIIVLILVLMLPVTFAISRSITRPLHQLERKLSQGASGNFAGRMEIQTKDEIGNLASYFNQFMDRLETSSRKIQAEITERRKTEELFSKAFHSSPSGIFIANIKTRRFIDANQSFLNFIGCSQGSIAGRSMRTLSMFQDEDKFSRILHLLRQEGRIRDMEVESVDASSEPRLGTINGEMVHIWGEPCMLCSLEDLTETKRLEREIIDISERERLQLGQYLHDDLCSHLLGIEVMQKVLQQRLAEAGHVDLEPVDRVRELVREAIDKTGRISRGLCPTYIAEQELELTLKELCRDIEQIYGVSCRLEHDSRTLMPAPATATHIFYIAREAACNAVKHGRAENIRLCICTEGRSAELLIHDDGCGIPENMERKGMGIRIMHYRARRIGAFLDIRKDAVVGTRVKLVFNLQQKQGADRNAFNVV
jgi:PAS domain S-box-containing protein